MTYISGAQTVVFALLQVVFLIHTYVSKCRRKGKKVEVKKEMVEGTMISVETN